jgi:hypothetical protein
MQDWEKILMEASGLPGSHVNRHLLDVVVNVGNQALFEHFLSYGPEVAPAGTPQEFLALCGVMGLGKLLAQGKTSVLPRLRAYADDPRPRVRQEAKMVLRRWEKSESAD